MSALRRPLTLLAGLAVSVVASGVAAQAAAPAEAPAFRPFEVVGDGIPRPLTDAGGDTSRGRAIVASRQAGLCLLCHPAPIPEERFQGDLAPSLAGVGARYSIAQLRLRVVDPRRVVPGSFMPAFHAPGHPSRVGAVWVNRPILSAQQVEDVVAFLTTLR